MPESDEMSGGFVVVAVLVVVIAARVIDNSAVTRNANVSKHSNVRPHCFGDKPNVVIDSAILKLNVNFATELRAQSFNCFKCPLVSICKPFVSKTTYVLMNTTFPSYVNIYSNGSYTCNENFSYQFGEYGIYELIVDKSSPHRPCRVNFLTKPVDSDLPVIYAVLILLALFFLYQVFFWAYKKCILRRYESFDVTNDASSNNELSIQVPVLKTSSRLVSIDMFRGISICLMIFVNYGGGKYWYFTHAAWNGLTVADLVFPWFMFIMGTSIAFSFEGQLRKGVAKITIAKRIFKRSLVLFAIGLFIVNHNLDWKLFRIPGVLQKIAASYFVVSLLRCITIKPVIMVKEYIYRNENQGFMERHTRELMCFWIEWIVMGAVVTVWLLLTFLMPVYGCPTGYLGPGGLAEGGQYANCTGGAAGSIDRFIFGASRIYQHPTCRRLYNSDIPYDPEGVLGTLMSIFAVFLGLQAGNILLLYNSFKDRAFRFVCLWIACGVLAGALCGFSQNHGVIPVNKNLWSLSFVLCLASLGYMLLFTLHVVVDVLKLWQGEPFHFIGMNSLLLYVGHEVFEDYFPLHWNPTPTTHAGYLAMNIWAVSIWALVAYLLHRKKLLACAVCGKLVIRKNMKPHLRKTHNIVEQTILHL